MATQEEARQALIDRIAGYAEYANGEELKAMAEAWQIVKKRENKGSTFA